VAFSGRRLLEEEAADAVLTVSAFEEQAPEAAGAPRIVLGRNEAPNASVFIPVATPGIHHAGHLFRTDSVVAVPLRALIAGRVPAAAQALLAIAQGLGK
jgi:formylmethanofuran dehydrogenase subunit B